MLIRCVQSSCTVCTAPATSIPLNTILAARANHDSNSSKQPQHYIRLRVESSSALQIQQFNHVFCTVGPGNCINPSTMSTLEPQKTYMIAFWQDHSWLARNA